MTYYKPLTPKFRKQINDSICDQMAELNACQNSPYVTLQKISLQTLENLISALPDGYPIPMERSDHNGK